MARELRDKRQRSIQTLNPAHHSPAIAGISPPHFLVVSIIVHDYLILPGYDDSRTALFGREHGISLIYIALFSKHQAPHFLVVNIKMAAISENGGEGSYPQAPHFLIVNAALFDR